MTSIPRFQGNVESGQQPASTEENKKQYAKKSSKDWKQFGEDLFTLTAGKTNKSNINTRILKQIAGTTAFQNAAKQDLPEGLIPEEVLKDIP